MKLYDSLINYLLGVLINGGYYGQGQKPYQAGGTGKFAGF